MKLEIFIECLLQDKSFTDFSLVNSDITRGQQVDRY